MSNESKSASSCIVEEFARLTQERDEALATIETLRRQVAELEGEVAAAQREQERLQSHLSEKINEAADLEHDAEIGRIISLILEGQDDVRIAYWDEDTCYDDSPAMYTCNGHEGETLAATLRKAVEDVE